MFFTILKTLVAFIALMFIGANLLGAIIRGVVSLGTVHSSRGTREDTLVRQNRISNIMLLLFYLIFTIGYFYLLAKYFNFWLAIAGAMLMISKFPDLLWEMRTGEKIRKQNISNRPIDILFNIIYWVALPIIWFSFYSAA